MVHSPNCSLPAKPLLTSYLFCIYLISHQVSPSKSRNRSCVISSSDNCQEYVFFIKHLQHTTTSKNTVVKGKPKRVNLLEDKPCVNLLEGKPVVNLLEDKPCVNFLEDKLVGG